MKGKYVNPPPHIMNGMTFQDVCCVFEVMTKMTIVYIETCSTSNIYFSKDYLYYYGGNNIVNSASTETDFVNYYIF